MLLIVARVCSTLI
uniref:Uncharacterized protein n=1 Tax=Rhizophora mucronata TaxID=61149 RepID=A0A2P2P2B2_RHIMU